MVQLSCSEWWPCLLDRGVSAILWYSDTDMWAMFDCGDNGGRCNTWIFACRIFCLWLFWTQAAQFRGEKTNLIKCLFLLVLVCTFYPFWTWSNITCMSACNILTCPARVLTTGRHRAAQSINCGQSPHCAINVSPLWRNVTCPARAVPSRAAHYTRSRVQTASEWAGLLSVVTKTTLLRTSKHFSTRLVAVTGPSATVPHQFSYGAITFGV